MPRGSKTPEEVVAQFRAEYLRLGNASEAGRKLDLPVSTSADLAKAANEDEVFVEARRAMYANALEEAGALMLDGIRVASERINEAPLKPREHAELMAEFGLKSLTLPDPRPQYLAQIVGAHKSLVALSKLEAEKNQEPGDLNLTIMAYPPSGEQVEEAESVDAAAGTEPSSE